MCGQRTGNWRAAWPEVDVGGRFPGDHVWLASHGLHLHACTPPCPPSPPSLCALHSLCQQFLTPGALFRAHTSPVILTEKTRTQPSVGGWIRSWADRGVGKSPLAIHSFLLAHITPAAIQRRLGVLPPHLTPCSHKGAHPSPFMLW